MPRPSKNTLVTKFSDLKRAVFRVDFGDAEHIKLSLMCDKEPKDALKQPFKAGSSLNVLALMMQNFRFLRKYCLTGRGR